MVESLKDKFELNIKVKWESKSFKSPYKYNKKSKNITFFSNSFWSKNEKKRLLQEKIVVAMIGAREISRNMESFEDNILKIFSDEK
jgi:uncharacterized membrane protein